MNDSAYVSDVTKNLVQMSKALFASGDLSMKTQQRSLTLDVDEV